MRTPCVAVFPALAAGALGLAASASAQTATVVVTAGGASSATIQPGQPVALNVTISFTGAYQLASIQGDLVVTPGVGSPSNFQFGLVGPLVNPGTFSGPSRLSISAAQSAPSPLINSWFSPVNLMTYDLTFTPSQAGVYSVVWQPAALGNVRLFPSQSSIAFAEAQTSFTGATITVTPAPATLALLGACPLASCRRRR